MTRHLSQVVQQVEDVLEGVFTSVEKLAIATQDLFDGDRRPSTADLEVIDPVAKAALGREDGLVVGAGYVAAEGALGDTCYWLQWWSDYETPRTWVPQRLLVQVDPGSESFNDYTTLPWFSAPRADGRRHVTGPYVDFLCTDEYTLTFTIPISGPSGFAGIVGADVYARVMESVVAPILAGIEGPSALLNAAGRVVASSRSTCTTGDMVRHRAVTAELAEAAADGRGSAEPHSIEGGEVCPCAGTGLAVVTGTTVAA